MEREEFEHFAASPSGMTSVYEENNQVPVVALRVTSATATRQSPASKESSFEVPCLDDSTSEVTLEYADWPMTRVLYKPVKPQF